MIKYSDCQVIVTGDKKYASKEELDNSLITCFKCGKTYDKSQLECPYCNK